MSSSMPSEVLSLCNAKNIKKPTQTPFDWLPLSRFYFLTQKVKKEKEKEKEERLFCFYGRASLSRLTTIYAPPPKRERASFGCTTYYTHDSCVCGLENEDKVKKRWRKKKAFFVFEILSNLPPRMSQRWVTEGLKLFLKKLSETLFYRH
jgi:hypothetical protein